MVQYYPHWAHRVPQFSQSTDKTREKTATTREGTEREDRLDISLVLSLSLCYCLFHRDKWCYQAAQLVQPESSISPCYIYWFFLSFTVWLTRKPVTEIWPQNALKSIYKVDRFISTLQSNKILSFIYVHVQVWWPYATGPRFAQLEFTIKNSCLTASGINSHYANVVSCLYVSLYLFYYIIIFDIYWCWYNLGSIHVLEHNYKNVFASGFLFLD